MAEFKSSTYYINCSSSDLSKLLRTPSNLVEILPADRIEDWNCDGDSCSFKITGLAHISLKLTEANESKIVYTNMNEKPFAFDLIINTKDAGDNVSELNALIDAEVNSFMSMMLNSPLSAFLNSLGEAIKNRY